MSFANVSILPLAQIVLSIQGIYEYNKKTAPFKNGSSFLEID